MKLEAVGEHNKDNELERYAFISKYPTHAESWNIVQTDHEPGELPFNGGKNNYLKTMGFQDREGNWWLIWHAFIHDNKRADEWLVKEIEEDSLWGDDKNTWTGVLTDAGDRT